MVVVDPFAGPSADPIVVPFVVRQEDRSIVAFGLLVVEDSWSIDLDLAGCSFPEDIDRADLGRVLNLGNFYCAGIACAYHSFRLLVVGFADKNCRVDSFLSFDNQDYRGNLCSDFDSQSHLRIVDIAVF